MATSSRSSSSSSTNYDVFLSFRGEDTRRQFTCHLCTELERDGTLTFKDDESLCKGEEITRIFDAIAGSRMSIPIFSQNYGNSKWCLDEIVKIMEAREKKGQMVIPIFYHVDPGDVKNQTGTFGEQFQQLANKSDPIKVESWKRALEQAVKLVGPTIKKDNENESEIIKKIVKDVRYQLKENSLDVHEDLVGIDSRVDEFLNLLDVESEDVKFIGISGMGGIGKTTIAWAVYNKICHKFDSRFFLEDVRGASEKTKDLIDLQKLLLPEHKIIRNVYEGRSSIKKCLHMKKVLIILDNVEHIDQLKALAGSSDWFGRGSRVIITSRNVQVLECNTNAIYEVEVLDSHQSRQLFYKHAFRKDHPSDDILQLAEDVASIARGLPLALEVLGDSLFNKKCPQIWKSRLEKLRKIPHKDIEAKLRTSYDDLDDIDQDIFLDIACFFNGTAKDYAIYIWEECGFLPESGIQNLIEKSLVKIVVCNGQDEIRMHDQLRDMGRHIVRQESSSEPGKRSRLWSQEDVLKVLKRREGTSFVQGIVFKFKKQETTSGVDCFSTEEFEAMSRLRLLQIDNVHLGGDFSKLTSELRWLSWKGCPLESIPIDFCLEKLAVLDLSWSRINQVWNGWHQNKHLEGLKILNLNGCKLLTQTPDFSRLPNLHKLDLGGCIELRELSPSICNLKSLKNLCVSGCSNLCRLPDSISNMRSLKTFSLGGTCISELPEDFGMLSSLRELSMYYCREFKGFSENFSRLPNLHTLDLGGCIELRELSPSICNLKSLKNLCVSGCSNLCRLPDSISNMRSLKTFSLGGTCISELPEDFGMLSSLRELSMSYCREFKGFSKNFSRLVNLEKLNLEGCIELRELPHNLCDLRSLKKLILSGCSNLNKLPDLLGYLEELEVIELDNCKSLCRLPDSIGGMRNLKTFSLAGTSIAELSDAIGLLEKVEILSMRRCSNLIKLPDSMGKMRLLREFSIDETGIVKLPEDFGMLSSLLELSMSDCREFRGFPENFSRLPKLEKLNLKGCTELRELASSFCELKSLKYLDISGCSNFNNGEESVASLKELEVVKLDDCKLVSRSVDWIGNMRYLKELSLDGTSITELPNEVGLLEKMEGLSVRRCSNLSKLPDSMGKMRHLRQFFISESCVGELPEDFGMLSSLENLLIYNCEEFKGFPESFGSLTRLDTLAVSGNSKLSMLPNSFSGLGSLENLYASGCNLSEDGIPTDIGKFSRLRELDLSYNNFCSLPASIVTLSKLEYLDLRNCRNLQSLPRLRRAYEVNVQNCVSLESIPHISDLKGVERLNLSNCERLAQIQGIDDHMERVEYLPSLLVSGCSGALVNSVKKSIGQQVERLRGCFIVFDGSKVPDCFTPLKISFPRTVEEEEPQWEMGPITFTNPWKNIISLFVCFVFTNPSVEAQVRYFIDIIDRNGEKHTLVKGSFFPLTPSKTHQHQFVIHGNFTDKCHYEGDLHCLLKEEASQKSLRIFIEEDYKMEVKECGVYPIYKDTEDSDYKRLADAISQETTSSKRTMSQLLYRDSNNHVHEAEASTSRSKRTKLKLLHHDNDDDNMEEVLVSRLQNMELD